MTVGADLAGLAREAQGGDQRAFGGLVEACWADLVRFARSVAGEADAEDVVQESLVAAWQDLAGLREPARVRAWLTSIVFRRALRRLRWWRLRTALDEVRGRVASADPSAAIDVARLLDRLAPRQRAVLHMTVVEGMTDAEIAETIRMAPATVRAHRRRARERIAQLLRGRER
jgi:RNA polymerase sigma-70 factor (ECF subfamily)